MVMECGVPKHVLGTRVCRPQTCFGLRVAPRVCRPQTCFGLRVAPRV